MHAVNAEERVASMNGGLLGGSTKTLKPPSGSSSPRKTASSAESISFPAFLDETIEPAFNNNDANGDGFWGNETEELKVTGPVSTVFGSDSRDFGPQANLPSGSRKTNDKEKNTTTGHTPKSVERRPVTLIRGPSDGGGTTGSCCTRWSATGRATPPSSSAPGTPSPRWWRCARRGGRSLVVLSLRSGSHKQGILGQENAFCGKNFRVASIPTSQTPLLVVVSQNTHGPIQTAFSCTAKRTALEWEGGAATSGS
eukprot:CAMPEP_0194664156 /NCGR_PEP_ID=MMETSP0295-20121207/1280_1 /TAXON_ID=39354 /ORGANISM="Heterosigma akashiwo, Strain CCMP2393" /LENGTH=253 /DNA_ID=CAMNT_0039545817 /DNA_START=297 /DNA_END=1054 /DNA_ORIENTATION=-